MKQHTTYKDSGIEWIGEIPEHWEVIRVKNLLIEINERSETGIEDLLSVSQYTGVTRRSDKTQEGDLLTNAASLEGYKLVKENDLVSNIMLAWNGSLGFSPYEGIVSPAYSIYRLSAQNNHRYFHYLFRTELYKAEFKRQSTGVVDSRLRLYTDRFFNIYSILPPLSEQAAIAEFLDEKTEKIDEAIRIKEREIELLKERRQILIQEVVTGKKVWHPDKEAWLPPTKTKDSGIEWIGEIPEEWEVRRLKHITTKIGSGITPRGGGLTYLDEGGVPLLRSQNILFGKIDLNEVARISPRTHESMKNSQVEKGDVLLNITGGSIGRCHYVEIDDPLNVNQHVCIIRPKGIKTEFLNFILSSKVGQNQIWYFQQGGGREGLNFQSIKNFFIPFPPKRHQIIIIEKTKTINSKISQLITLKEEEIEKLKEYKTVLIDAAVTGKVKVGENACPSA